jgi:hypothetical protein
MKSENTLLALAIAAVLVAAVGAGFTYSSIASYKETWFTGFVTSTGTANLTVITSAAINFTTNNINWGAGRVNLGATNATLITIPQINNSGGNWTNVTSGFVIENIGNVNVTLWLKTGKTAATFIGGTNPQYQFNVTNIEAKSCTNRSAFNLNVFYDVNTTDTGVGAEGTWVCSNFSYVDSLDEVRIDLKVVVPSDSLTGALGDIMTASAYQSA